MLRAWPLSGSVEGLSGSYDLGLVSLSIFISILAAYASLDLAGRITKSKGNRQFAWLCGGGLAMGIGIWAMHYIGMEAFRLPLPVEYDWPTVLVSLFAAVFSSAVVLFIVSRPALALFQSAIGSIVMGGGIAGMHYIGMDAMRLPARCIYSPALVVASILLAVAISFIALRFAFALREDAGLWGWKKAGSAVIMGTAISSMHYVGMAGASFTPSSVINGDLRNAVSVSSLALACIAVVTVMVLATVIVTTSVNRQFASQSQRLAESKAQLQAIFDNMSEGVVLVDRSHNIVHANRTAMRFLDLPNQAVAVKDVVDRFECYLPAGKKLEPDQLPSARAFRGEYLKDCSLKIKNKATGKELFVEVSSCPIADSTGDVRQVMITYRDIAAREQMDVARSRLAAIVDSSEDAIIGKSDEGIVTSWNAAAKRLFGYAEVEMIGQSIRILLPADREQEEDAILLRIKRGETVSHFETLRQRKDGQLINVSISVSPIKDASGRIIGASKIARDITHTKQIERQVRHSQKMEAIGQLTGGIAHDFNNLLAIVMGNLELLERIIPDRPDALKRVQTAKKAAFRGGDLTRRLLVFSRKEELRPCAVHIGEAINNTIELASRTIGPEIKITAQFDASIPKVFADPSMLENALLNLVVNARDAMPKGGVLTFSTEVIYLDENYPAVRTNELAPGQYACIAVSDTGQGMSKETLDRAFEPFFTTKPRDKGTGLGLATVYGFVRQSGGIARIYSEQGYGTTVSLYLPLAAKDEEPASDRPSIPAVPNPGGKVLVVDDEPDLLEVAVAFLEEMGYSAVQAADGPSALEVFAKERAIFLLITDVIMPGSMNGVALASRIRELNPSVKVIYSSGFPANALSERSGGPIHGPLLHKPFQREEFRTAILNIMKGAENT